MLKLIRCPSCQKVMGIVIGKLLISWHNHRYSMLIKYVWLAEEAHYEDIYTRPPAGVQ